MILSKLVNRIIYLKWDFN